MKKNCILIVIILHNVFSVSAQENLSEKMQAAFDACWSMRMAISAGNTASLRSANNAFRACDTKDFKSIRQTDSKIISLDGHFVWDEDFVDSLIAGRDVRRFAQRYAENREVRGTSGKGNIYTKTCMVKGRGKAKFTFVSRNRQELAVITEPGGRVTLRVHDTTSNKWYNDTEDVKRGKESRIMVFDLPTGKLDTLEVEVTNCGKDDTSFVIISN